MDKTCIVWRIAVVESTAGKMQFLRNIAFFEQGQALEYMNGLIALCEMLRFVTEKINPDTWRILSRGGVSFAIGVRPDLIHEPDNA